MSSTAALAAARPPAAGNDYYGAVLSRREEIEAAYRALTPRSAALYGEAGKVLPGGFTRDAVMRRPYAPFVTSGAGTKLTDADGRTLVDFWFNATSLPLGHAHPKVVEAAERQLRKGTAYFAPTEHELELARLLVERIPSAEKIRFTNSGSEGVMMAVRFARAFTGRSLIVKFEGSYHGSYDDVSWSVAPGLDKAGEAASPVPVAESAGLAGTGGRVAVLPFNDAATLRRFVDSRHGDIAAILVEPLANRIGLVLPEKAFLAEARELCDRHGIVLVFDEVIAFRIGYRGAQGVLGVTPDLTTLGKIIGGGFPVGAVAGRADILDLSDPDRAGRVTHAGTFNANPMVAVAGFATMSLLTPEAFAKLDRMGATIRKRLTEICDGLPLQVTGTGSLFKITATASPIRHYRDAATANKAWEAAVSLALINEGFVMTPTLSGTASMVTSEAEIEAFLGAFAKIVTQ